MRRAALLAAAAAVLAGSAWAAIVPSRPDPNAHALADGCARELAGLFKKEVTTWAYVGDADAPAGGPPPAAQWVAGTVRSPLKNFGVHPTPVDDPFTHDSYDVILNVVPDPADTALVGKGNFAADGEEKGVLHTELEQRAFPFFAWPEEGDRVSMLGSWVWDCGHFQGAGERTELHPFRALWVERGFSPRSPYGESEADLLVSTVKTFAGVEADCAHQTKGDRAAFHACVSTEPDWQDVSGTYTFTLAAPPKPAPGAKLTYRVVDAGSTANAPKLTVKAGAGGLTVTVQVKATAPKKLVLAREVFAGWSPTPAASLPEHLRLTFGKLLVRRAMDPGCVGATDCASVESTHHDQISTAPGEWTFYWDVAGIWSMWSPLVLAVNDGDVVPGTQSVDVYVPRSRGWRLFTFARECDFTQLSPSNQQAPPYPCPAGTGEFGNAIGDDSSGVVADRYASPAAAVGRHTSNALLDESSCPPANTQGCYALTYEVTRIDDAAVRAARLK